MLVRMIGRRAHRSLGLLAALSPLAGALALAAPAAASTTQISSNWAGYVARPASSLGTGFRRVAGSWTEPTARCPTGRSSYSAVWVGLGGYSRSDDALEQIGTDADCSSTGAAHYSAWFELLPAASVDVPLRISPGDELTASVTVHGRRATLRLADLTSGRRYSTVRTLSSVDVSTAEWIVEAPSECDGAGSCRTLTLADFDQVGFSSATAQAGGHTGTAADPEWRTTRLLLRQAATAAIGASPASRGGFSLISATPSSLSADFGAFSVLYGERSGSGEEPQAPTLPGFSGGSPP